MIRKYWRPILFVCACIPLNAHADNLSDGVALFSAGNYEAALPLVQPYSEKGDWVAQMMVQNINKAIPHHPIVGNGPRAENLRDFYKTAPSILNKLTSKEEIASFEQERDILEYGYQKEIEKQDNSQHKTATQQLSDFNKAVPGITRDIDAMPNGPMKDAVWKDFNEQKTNLERKALAEQQASGQSDPYLEYSYRNDESELRMSQLEDQAQRIEQHQHEMEAEMHTNEIFDGAQQTIDEENTFEMQQKLDGMR